jgi:hypothetical protein
MFSYQSTYVIPEFNQLNEQEVELMQKAPILVSILIAGADGTIDKKEVKQAITIAEKESQTKSVLKNYFKELSEDFEDKIRIYIQSYPYETTQRTPLLVDELAKINTIWNKVDGDFATEFYEMLLKIATKIARSSGGLFGLTSSIGAEEAKWMNLPMLSKPNP